MPLAKNTVYFISDIASKLQFSSGFIVASCNLISNIPIVFYRTYIKELYLIKQQDIWLMPSVMDKKCRLDNTVIVLCIL